MQTMLYQKRSNVSKRLICRSVLQPFRYWRRYKASAQSLSPSVHPRKIIGYTISCRGDCLNDHSPAAVRREVYHFVTFRHILLHFHRIWIVVSLKFRPEKSRRPRFSELIRCAEKENMESLVAYTPLDKIRPTHPTTTHLNCCVNGDSLSSSSQLSSQS